MPCILPVLCTVMHSTWLKLTGKLGPYWALFIGQCAEMLTGSGTSKPVDHNPLHVLLPHSSSKRNPAPPCLPFRVSPVVRAKLRRGMTLFMGALTPALGSGSAVPDVLLLNVLPWAEDLRLHAFTTFRCCPECHAVLGRCCVCVEPHNALRRWPEGRGATSSAIGRCKVVGHLCCALRFCARST